MTLTEKRTDKRRHLIYYLSALERSTRSLVGYVYDITTHGMLILSSEPIEPGTECEFEILLPQGLSLSERFFIRAECRWSQQDLNPQNFIAGFSFIDIDRSTAVTINALIARFGFQD